MRKFESTPRLKPFSSEQVLNLAARAREVRSQGGVVPEGVLALSLARIVREYNALRADNKHILDEILPTLPPELESESRDKAEWVEEGQSAKL